MKRKVHPTIYAGKQMPWGKAVVVDNLIFMGGSSGRLRTTGMVDPAKRNDAAAQVEDAMDKIKDWLEELGSSLENIVKVTIYVKDMQKDGAAVHKAYEDYFQRYAPSVVNEWPAETIVGVDSLYYPEMLVEIDITAVIPE